MALSTGEKLGVALLAGSLVIVAILIGLILLGFETSIGLWNPGIKPGFELAGGH